MRRQKRTYLVAASAAFLTLLTPSIAHADLTGSSTNGDADTQDTDQPDISATAWVRFNTDKNGSSSNGSPTGSLKPTGNWSPPPCWYRPTYTPAQLKASSETVWGEQSPSWEWISKQKAYYADGEPYTDFNMENADKGYWWSGYSPKENGGVKGANDCNDPPFWVDKGDPPPPGHQNAVTADVLAQLAYRRILIPTGAAAVNPPGSQAVRIPTWVWLDPAVFHPVSVTAYVTDYNVTATTTAEPVSIHIDPGTPYAQTFPASGDCTGIGTAYNPGDEGNPPCGVVYLKDTDGASFQMTVTVTWKITWVGTGHPDPQGLPAGTFPHDQDVIVREIQSINR
ncbi:hypothetical protein [Streptomyces sp. NPDC049040]|uniref:hypothetical protein n=1 Tax=Streptomyces sp. NPDC049040 TaxID=3365593 RepID=UPI00371CD546